MRARRSCIGVLMAIGSVMAIIGKATMLYADHPVINMGKTVHWQVTEGFMSPEVGLLLVVAGILVWCWAMKRK